MHAMFVSLGFLAPLIKTGAFLCNSYAISNNVLDAIYRPKYEGSKCRSKVAVIGNIPA
jgi:hypothetical protein